MTETDITELSERIERESAFIEPLLAEVRRVVVGQARHGRAAADRAAERGARAARRRPRPRQDAHGLDARRARSPPASSASSSRRTSCPPTSSARSSTTRRSPTSSSRRARSSPTSSWPTRSTARPAKVQSALLEAMQERQVTIGETTFPLQEPFLVLATQNPIEQEGTYPLPEAQVDRFMLKIVVGLPDARRGTRRSCGGWRGPAPVPDASARRRARADPRRPRSCSPISTWTSAWRGTSWTSSSPRGSPRRYRLSQARGAHRLRRQPARVDLPQPRRPRPRLPPAPRLRHARRRPLRSRSTCSATASA